MNKLNKQIKIKNNQIIKINIMNKTKKIKLNLKLNHLILKNI